MCRLAMHTEVIKNYITSCTTSGATLVQINMLLYYFALTYLVQENAHKYHCALAKEKESGNNKESEFFITEALSEELLREIGGPVRSSEFLTTSNIVQSGKLKTLHKILDTFCNKLMEKVYALLVCIYALLYVCMYVLLLKQQC